MNQRFGYYTTMVVFGDVSYEPDSRFSGERLRDYIGTLAKPLRRYCEKIKARGYVEGEKGKDITPRRGLLNDRLLGLWETRADEGRFVATELFGPSWTNDEAPHVYSGLHLYRGNEAMSAREPSQPLIRPIGCCLTLAIRNELLDTSNEELRSGVVRLTREFEGFFGFLIRDRPWGIPILGLESTNVLGLMNYHWHEYPSEYGYGRLNMRSEVTRLYKGNILSREHLKITRPEELPLEDVEYFEEFAPGRYYIELKDDIYRFPAYREKWSRFVNLVPPGDYYFVGSPKQPLVQNFTA